jgi:hypothetical protein
MTGKMLMIWKKEEVMICLKVLFWYLGEIEENHENFSQQAVNRLLRIGRI